MNKLRVNGKTIVPEPTMKRRQRRVLSENHPTVRPQRQPTKDRPLIIAGGGCSLEDTFTRDWGEFDVMALNGTARWLVKRGFTPDYQVIIDPRKRVHDYIIDPHPEGMEILVSAVVHKAVFKAIGKKPYRVFYTVPDQEIPAVGGGPTVGLRAICLAHLLGYSEIHLHGFDSSYREGRLHAYGDRPNLQAIEVWSNGKAFVTTPGMAHQVQEFVNTVAMVEREGTDVYIHGTGLLPWAVRHYGQAPEQLDNEAYAL